MIMLCVGQSLSIFEIAEWGGASDWINGGAKFIATEVAPTSRTQPTV